MRVWQDVEDERDIHVGARPADGSWRTLGMIPLALDDGVSSTRCRYGNITLNVAVHNWETPGAVEVRVWQGVVRPGVIYISARPARGSWLTLGTVRLLLDDGISSTGHRFGDISLEVTLPADGVTTLAGRPGERGYADGPAGEALFARYFEDLDLGLAVDRDGSVVVADSSSASIRRILPDGSVTTIAGGNGQGVRDGPADTAQFVEPKDVAIAPDGSIYVADIRSHRIRKIAPDGTVTTVAGGGPTGGRGTVVDGPSSDARFASPNGIAIDDYGDIYIIEYHQRIRRLSPSGWVLTYAGASGLGHRDGPVSGAQFQNLLAVDIDARGNLYVVDSRDGGPVSLRRIDTDGMVETLYRDPHAGRGGTLAHPVGIAVSDNGVIYIANTGRHQIVLLTGAGNLRAVAGTGVAGYTNGALSDAFEETRAQLEAERDQGADPDHPDEYLARNILWVPKEARWSVLQAQARQSTIGQTVDEAMTAIEEANPALRDVLPKDYARPALDKQRLGQLIDQVSNIVVGDEDARSRDVLGRVYEYFLSRFAESEGKRGGEFYTPRSVVRLLVEMLEPYEGRVYDPCCGSSGMFVQSLEFIRAHATGNGNGGKASAPISIWGQESNHTTWRLAKMNLAIRGIEGQIAHGDSFHNDRHPDLRADYILANPPFNVSDWGGERLADDQRWQYGVPPAGNANFAWVQHFVHHLAPAGIAGFVLANGSMSSNQRGEGEIRERLVEEDMVDCMVAMPGQLFYSTQIPACLWFLARDRRNSRFRDRRGEVLFIDARAMGRMTDRTHRELTAEDIARIADTYHAWRGEEGAGEYADVPGFCKSADIDEVRRHGHVLTPGRYVGAAPQEDDGEPFEEKMTRLAAQWREQRAEGDRLDAEIEANLRALGYGGNIDKQ